MRKNFPFSRRRLLRIDGHDNTLAAEFLAASRRSHVGDGGVMIDTLSAPARSSP